jgi:hypothetical protein
MRIRGDTDSDGWFDDMDNCPVTYNPGQEEDWDEDYIGDACDAPNYDYDFDGDGINDISSGTTGDRMTSNATSRHLPTSLERRELSASRRHSR